MTKMNRSFFVMSTLGVIFCITSFLAGQETASPELKIEPVVEGDVAWYDVAQWPTEGQGYTDMGRRFARFPAKAQGVIPSGVWGLSQHSAGLVTRFKTDADRIQIRFTLFSASLAMPHMPATGESGFDLYAEKDGQWLWAGNTQPTAQTQSCTMIDGMVPEARRFMMFFPLYNGVEKVELGVPTGSTFSPELPLAAKPIVYYGTSIAHGGCASRPGNAYTAMLTRRLNVPVINLGFSGSGRMEPEMGDLIAELDPAVFVLDCIPNMVDPEINRQRVVPFIEKLRAAHPDTPILMVEGRHHSNDWLKPGLNDTYNQIHAIYREAFDHFVNAGDKNIYYLPSTNLLGDQEDRDGTVDSSHPNDLGMYRQANELERVLRPILGL